MRKWIGGMAATVIAGVLTWWLTEGMRDRINTSDRNSEPASSAGSLSPKSRPDIDEPSRLNACGHRLGPAIYAKWQQLEGDRGLLGCPLTDEDNAPASPRGTKGRWALFAGNGSERGFVFLHDTGDHAGQAFEVHGAIGRKYDAMGKTASWLGFPLSDEYDMPVGEPRARQSDFEGGHIAFDSPSRTYQAFHQ